MGPAPVKPRPPTSFQSNGGPALSLVPPYESRCFTNQPLRVHNGVVVLDASVSLPEGAAVNVGDRTSPMIRVAKNQKRVEFPLVPSSKPGSVHLTNEMIAEILDEVDAAS